MGNFRFLWLVVFQSSCVASHSELTPAPVPVIAEEVLPKQAEPPKLQVVKVEPELLTETDLDAAMASLANGRKAYWDGNYDDAERSLKDALLLYPFLPEARLLLAKVLLVRGAASRDLATLKLAKLMLEMALAMQPDLSEAHKLLELFRTELPLDSIKEP